MRQELFFRPGGNVSWLLVYTLQYRYQITRIEKGKKENERKRKRRVDSSRDTDKEGVLKRRYCYILVSLYIHAQNDTCIWSERRWAKVGGAWGGFRLSLGLFQILLLKVVL